MRSKPWIEGDPINYRSQEEPMEPKDLLQALGLQVGQRIREFEEISGMVVTGFQLKRNEKGGIELVKIMTELRNA